MWSCRPGSLYLATGGRVRLRVSFSAPDCEGKECGLENQLVFQGGRELVLFGSLPVTPPLSALLRCLCVSRGGGRCAW